MVRPPATTRLVAVWNNFLLAGECQSQSPDSHKARRDGPPGREGAGLGWDTRGLLVSSPRRWCVAVAGRRRLASGAGCRQSPTPRIAAGSPIEVPRFLCECVPDLIPSDAKPGRDPSWSWLPCAPVYLGSGYCYKIGRSCRVDPLSLHLHRSGTHGLTGVGARSLGERCPPFRKKRERMGHSGLRLSPHFSHTFPDWGPYGSLSVKPSGTVFSEVTPLQEYFTVNFLGTFGIGSPHKWFLTATTRIEFSTWL